MSAIRFFALYIASAVGSPTGTIAQTLPSLTQAASGKETFTGTAVQTLPSLTQAASGTTTSLVTGTAAQTLPSLAQAASGKEVFTGTAAQTLPSLTQAAAGTSFENATGTVAQTLPSLAQSATGAETLGQNEKGLRQRHFFAARPCGEPSELLRAFAAAYPAAPRPLEVEGAPYLLFTRPLNPGSLFPVAHEVCVFPLTDLVSRQWQLRWQVLGAGAMVLLVGLGASHFASLRLSAPVERLAVDSERSARFSADASHQLKTPVTVLRAGLEELLARDKLTPEECDQISALIHQTYRLSSLIEDLLLLSRMDAGRLKLEASTVNLTQLIEAAVDDLSAAPDELGVTVETDYPDGLLIVGEKRYTAIILHNLLENARKYNRRGGRVRVSARRDGGNVRLTVGNTGQAITPAAQGHIFERFHRGAMGENVPGYGLGLNLARELARLHGGDLRLGRSDANGTEFEVVLRAAPAVAAGTEERCP